MEEQEILWEHEPLASVPIAFSSSPKFSRVFPQIDRNMENMFSISFREHATKKGNFDHLSVNSLCLCHHYVADRAISVFLSSSSINLPEFYHECCSLIGCATHYLLNNYIMSSIFLSRDS